MNEAHAFSNNDAVKEDVSGKELLRSTTWTQSLWLLMYRLRPEALTPEMRAFYAKSPPRSSAGLFLWKNRSIAMEQGGLLPGLRVRPHLRFALEDTEEAKTLELPLLEVLHDGRRALLGALKRATIPRDTVLMSIQPEWGVLEHTPEYPVVNFYAVMKFRDASALQATPPKERGPSR
jgi:hypothetical protein